MDISLIIFVVIALTAITLLYKVLPHRDLGEKKPFISFFPKYKTNVALPTSILNKENPERELETVLSQYGFVKRAQSGDITKYSRGHILGDLSIKLAKVNLLVTTPESNCVDISIEAGWVVAFDTGDFWKFLLELKEKVENIT